MPPKEKRRIVPQLVTDAQAPDPRLFVPSEKPVARKELVPANHASMIGHDFMRSLNDPRAHEYFEQRAKELGYDEVKVKARGKKKAEPAGPTEEEVEPEVVVTKTSSGEHRFNGKSWPEFIERYIKYKKHSKAETMRQYLKKNYQAGKVYNTETKRFRQG